MARARFGFGEGLVVMLFLSVPALSTLLMLAPSHFRNALALHIHNPKWWQLFSSAFVHRDFNHLWSNLALYIILSLLLISLFLESRERVFVLLVAFLFVSVPLASSLVQLALYPIKAPNVQLSQGSSTLVSSLVGALPLLWAYSLTKRRIVKLFNLNFLYACLLYLTLCLAFIYAFQLVVLGYLLAVFTLAVFAFSYFKFIFPKSKKNGVLDNGFLAMLLFLISPLFLFPREIVVGGSKVDVFMHFFGVVYGLVFGFILLSVKAKK